MGEEYIASSSGVHDVQTETAEPESTTENITNLPTGLPVADNIIPARIQRDHPISNVIGDLEAGV